MSGVLVRSGRRAAGAAKALLPKVGFSDPSNFARFFRKNTGMTPQGFRERRGG